MLDHVLELLGHVARRPSMYFNPESIGELQAYLSGLEAGCALSGLQVSREAYQHACAARGWNYRATGIVWHMKSKGLTKEAIIQELIAVEAAAFRLVAETK